MSVADESESDDSVPVDEWELYKPSDPALKGTDKAPLPWMFEPVPGCDDWDEKGQDEAVSDGITLYDWPDIPAVRNTTALHAPDGTP
ncbi:hypothetical protein [Mycobacterium colombiense]|uniref:hypothetical protein n=1 Tax=Mycobacterium colombiense TaxID=339268 RepID=UPI001058282D|nr:hypothetical protein [Mycobacterium colombiense]